MASYPTAQEPGLFSDSTRARTRFDIWLVLSALILFGFGLLCLYSESAHIPNSGKFFQKQLVNFGLGIVPFAIFAVTKPKSWMRAWPVLYILSVASLVLVLVHGSAKNGSARWIEIGSVQFQPSEMAKVFTVITLASFYVMRREDINKLSTFLLGLLHVAVPMVLIFLQPHTGAAMVIAIIWLAVSLAAHVPFKFLGPTVFIGMTLLGALVIAPEKFPMLIKPYQLLRMKKMHGFQTNLARTAFGAGGVIGVGFDKGEVIKNIPEIENDFVFTTAGEELGLVGCTLILCAYAFFFFRIWQVMLHAEEPYYRMLVIGVLGILVFHTFVNLLMITGILPVIGLWLPFMSYGGTALWLCMSCVGIVLNVRRHERPILF